MKPMLNHARYDEPANLDSVSVEEIWQLRNLPIIYTNINNRTVQFD